MSDFVVSARKYHFCFVVHVELEKQRPLESLQRPLIVSIERNKWRLVINVTHVNPFTRETR
jgi:hypothetical protein